MYVHVPIFTLCTYIYVYFGLCMRCVCIHICIGLRRRSGVALYMYDGFMRIVRSVLYICPVYAFLLIWPRRCYTAALYIVSYNLYKYSICLVVHLFAHAHVFCFM